MGFRSSESEVTKFEYAALIGAALASIATRSGDLVGLDIVAGDDHVSLPTTAGQPAFERVVAALVAAQPQGSFAESEPELEGLLARAVHRTAPGSLLLLTGDLLDLPERAPEIIATALPADRQLVVLQVLDPLELDFSFQGAVRLRSSEGEQEVETNASVVRQEYLQRLEALQSRFRDALVRAGSGLVVASTSDDPGEVLRTILTTTERAISE